MIDNSWSNSCSRLLAKMKKPNGSVGGGCSAQGSMQAPTGRVYRKRYSQTTFYSDNPEKLEPG